tara:strand:+ start:949 stop:1155 length:207 start_codon:yes stop_codon:yes gene_type:complete
MAMIIVMSAFQNIMYNATSAMALLIHTTHSTLKALLKASAMIALKEVFFGVILVTHIALIMILYILSI